MKKKFSLGLVLLLVLSLAMVGCSPSKETSNNGKGLNEASTNPGMERQGSEDTIIIGLPEAKGEFMPVYAVTAYDQTATEYVFDSLLSNDEEGSPKAHVAKDWEVSDDFKTYTFYLRDDVKFSDGKPLTAYDVEFTYKIIADPNYDGREFSTAARIEGYEDYYEGDADNISGIEVIDDYTISFTFKEAESTNIWECNMGIMPKHYYDFEKGDIDTLKEKMDEPLGSGPYIMTAHEPKQHIEYKANKDYFLGEPKIENLILKFTTGETEMQELTKGTIDVALGATTTPENEEIVDEVDFLHINAYPNNGYCFLGWNLRDPRFEDKRVRKALTYGFNRQQFVDTFFKGHGEVADVPLSQVSWAYTEKLEESLNKYEYNPEKAIELLEEAGWVEGPDGIREKDGMRLEFDFLTFKDVEWVDRIIPMLKSDWEKIGVSIEPNLIEFNALQDIVYQDREFDIFSLCWGFSIDPDNSRRFHSREDIKGGSNAMGFRYDKNDELLDAGLLEQDQEKRKEIYEEWALMMNEELPQLYIYVREDWNIVNDRIKNFNCDSFIDETHPDVVLNMEIEN